MTGSADVLLSPTHSENLRDELSKGLVETARGEFMFFRKEYTIHEGDSEIMLLYRGGFTGEA